MQSYSEHLFTFTVQRKIAFFTPGNHTIFSPLICVMHVLVLAPAQSLVSGSAFAFAAVFAWAQLNNLGYTTC